MGVHAVTSEYSVFPYGGKKRYFSCSPLSIMLYNGVSICEYWHMNFSLIRPGKVDSLFSISHFLDFEAGGQAVIIHY